MKKLYASLMLALLLASVSVNVVFAMTGRDFKNLQKVYTNPYTGKPFVYDPGGSSSISESTAELGSGRALYNDRVRAGGYNSGPSNTGVPSGNITPTQQPDPNAAPLPKITFGLPPDSPFHPDNFNKGSKSKDNNDKSDGKDNNGSVGGNVNGNNNGGNGGNNEKSWPDKLWDDTKILGGSIWGGIKKIGGGIWYGAKIVGGNIKNGTTWIGGVVWDGVKSGAGAVFGFVMDAGSGIKSAAIFIYDGAINFAKNHPIISGIIVAVVVVAVVVVMVKAGLVASLVAAASIAIRSMVTRLSLWAPAINAFARQNWSRIVGLVSKEGLKKIMKNLIVKTLKGVLRNTIIGYIDTTLKNTIDVIRNTAPLVYAWALNGIAGIYLSTREKIASSRISVWINGVIKRDSDNKLVLLLGKLKDKANSFDEKTKKRCDKAKKDFGIARIRYDVYVFNKIDGPDEQIKWFRDNEKRLQNNKDLFNAIVDCLGEKNLGPNAASVLKDGSFVPTGGTVDATKIKLDDTPTDLTRNRKPVPGASFGNGSNKGLFSVKFDNGSGGLTNVGGATSLGSFGSDSNKGSFSGFGGGSGGGSGASADWSPVGDGPGSVNGPANNKASVSFSDNRPSASSNSVSNSPVKQPDLTVSNENGVLKVHANGDTPSFTETTNGSSKIVISDDSGAVKMYDVSESSNGTVSGGNSTIKSYDFNQENGSVNVSTSHESTADGISKKSETVSARSESDVVSGRKNTSKANTFQELDSFVPKKNDFDISNADNWSLEKSQEYAASMAEKIKGLESAGGSRADFLEGVVLLDRFEQSSVAKDFGLMAEGVYGDGSALNTLTARGWSVLDDASKFGLPDSILNPSGGTLKGFEADVFVKGNEMVVAFEGTDKKSWNDWVNNVSQDALGDSPYYAHARKIGRIAQKSAVENGLTLKFTGHSLGGGLSHAAGVETGLDAYGFNPARLSSKRIGADTLTSPNLKFFSVEGDPLTAVQDSKFADGWISATDNKGGEAVSMNACETDAAMLRKHESGCVNKSVGADIKQYGQKLDNLGNVPKVNIPPSPPKGFFGNLFGKMSFAR